MTIPTKEQCVQWARECEASVAETQVGQAWLPWKISFRPDQLHAFALKVLAESEDRRDAERLDCIRKLCGYVEDGSDQTVRILQDDATRDWFVEVGQFGRSKTKGSGRSFKAAIDAAIEAEKGRTE